MQDILMCQSKYTGFYTENELNVKYNLVIITRVHHVLFVYLLRLLYF